MALAEAAADRDTDTPVRKEARTTADGLERPTTATNNGTPATPMPASRTSEATVTTAASASTGATSSGHRAGAGLGLVCYGSDEDD